MPAAWLFPSKRTPTLTVPQYSMFTEGHLNTSFHWEEDVPLLRKWTHRMHFFSHPEELIYMTLAYATDFASMNHSYQDYGKRPEHIPDLEDTLAGDLHRSTFIYR